MRVFEGENKMLVEAACDTLLETLRKNRSEHANIVREAREGYIVAARAALEARLAEINAGKVVALQFNLSPPQDHTKVYDTAIRMLELHTKPTITLDATKVRGLVMDEWDWTSSFLVGASMYSVSANNKLNG